MNVGYFLYHSVERPQDLFLVDGEREFRYNEAVRDLWKFVGAVREFGLARGNSVAIGCDDFYTHLLLILAFEHLGITTASFHDKEGRKCQALLGSVDLVLAEAHYPPGGWKTRAITPAWLQSVFARSGDGPLPAAAQHPDDVLRIVRTSGTTGDAKRFHMLRREAAARLAQSTWLNRDMPQDIGALLTLPLSLGMTYRSTTIALCFGWTIVVANRIEMAEIPALIQRHRIGRLTLLPIQLKHVLDALPAGWVKPERLEIASAGAPMPEELRRIALRTLASRVTDIYGSNEIGTIAITRLPDRGGFGTICPDVDLDIVDEADRPVADGVAGRIRIRNQGGFRGYLDDQTLTRRMLRDGWFYPGDSGIRQGNLLQVIGRTDDQVNLGGTKLPLTRIEAVVQTSGGAAVKDIGAVAIASDAGLDELHIALVTDGSDDRALLDRIIAVVRPMVNGGLHFIRLPQIPRNDMGKIDRPLLKEAVLAAHAAARTDGR